MTLAEVSGFFGEYRFLSNFHVADVVFEGDTYLSSEHAYQAAKRPKSERGPFQSRTLSCKDAKRLGGPGATTIDGTWDARRIDVMLRVVRDKFSRHRELREKLLATGDAKLVETNSWHDNLWGDCDCVRCVMPGKNMLGKILMDVRHQLRTAILETPTFGVPMSSEPDLAAAERAVEHWQGLVAKLEHARSLITMDEAGEALGDLFAGVLPALKLHEEHQLEDCLACGNKITLPELAERIALAEQYVAEVATCREARKEVKYLTFVVEQAEQNALQLMGADGGTPAPAPVAAAPAEVDPDPVLNTGYRLAEEEAVLIEYEWNKEQRERMTRNARRLIFRDRLQGKAFSVLKDGTLYDLKTQRPMVLSLESTKW